VPCDTYTWDEATHTCDMTTIHIKWDFCSPVTQDIYTPTYTTRLYKLRRYVTWDIYTSSKTSAAILHATFAATFAHEGDQHNTNRFIHVCMLTQTDSLIYVQIRPMHMQRDLHTSTKKEINFFFVDVRRSLFIHICIYIYIYIDEYIYIYI